MLILPLPIIFIFLMGTYGHGNFAILHSVASLMLIYWLIFCVLGSFIAFILKGWWSLTWNFFCWKRPAGEKLPNYGDCIRNWPATHMSYYIINAEGFYYTKNFFSVIYLPPIFVPWARVAEIEDYKNKSIIRFHGLSAAIKVDSGNIEFELRRCYDIYKKQNSSP